VVKLVRRSRMGSEILKANLESIKGTYQCDEIAESFGETALYDEGGKKRGRCPIHNGESPSFFCYPDEQGRFTRWQCFRCTEGGDVIDLYAAIHGPFSSVWHTVMDFADRYHLKLWREEDYLSNSQLMLKRAREGAQKRLNRYYNDLAYRQSVLPMLYEIEDLDMRRVENERCLRILDLA
jgi:DNA primase